MCACVCVRARILASWRSEASSQVLLGLTAIIIYSDGRLRLRCVCACVRVCVCACVRACVCVVSAFSVRTRFELSHVFA